MKKLIKTLIASAVTLSMLVGIAGKTEASSSQASYKLTAYNSKGKKVNVSAPKNMVVTSYKSGWYKGSLKYITYKKNGSKWVKQTKTATVYIPSKYVKKYTTTTYKWEKKTKNTQGYLKVGEVDKDYVTLPAGSQIYNDLDEVVYAQDSKGKNVLAKTSVPTKVTVNSYEVNTYDDFDKDGVIDTEDTDVDNDGSENYYSGYGYRKDYDYDNDNDGIVDSIEYYYTQDIDKDGIINMNDNDCTIKDAFTIDNGKTYYYSWTEMVDDDTWSQTHAGKMPVRHLENVEIDTDVDNDGMPNDEDFSYTTTYKHYEFGQGYVSYVDYDKKTTTTVTYKTTATTQAYTKVYVPPVKNGITLAEFNKIKTGMTYQQVVQIIGESGKLDAQSSGYGTTIKIYSWSQPSTYGAASILFENNKVQSKSQAGLK